MKNDNDIEQSSSLLLKVVTNVMRPLVKLMIARGVTFPMMTEILKKTYVEVAEADYKLDLHKPMTNSRITLLTKVHRKDVRRLRAEEESAPISKAAIPLGAQIIAKWLASDDYRDQQGEPLSLYKLASKAGQSPSFENLVRSLNNDIRPRVVLDELLSQNIVTEVSSEEIKLNQAAFIPQKDLAELLSHFNRNIHDHMAAAVDNVEGKGRPLFERAVYYKSLSSESIKEIEELVEKQGMDALVAVNKTAYDCSEKDQTPSGQSHRMTFGMYFYTEQEEQE